MHRHISSSVQPLKVEAREGWCYGPALEQTYRHQAGHAEMAGNGSHGRSAARGRNYRSLSSSYLAVSFIRHMVAWRLCRHRRLVMMLLNRSMSSASSSSRWAQLADADNVQLMPTSSYIATFAVVRPRAISASISSLSPAS